LTLLAGDIRRGFDLRPTEAEDQMVVLKVKIAVDGLSSTNGSDVAV
jgi:hypothetical protein